MIAVRIVLLVLAITLLSCGASASGPAIGEPERAAEAADAARRALRGMAAHDSDEPDEVLLAARAHLHLALLDDSHRQEARELLERLLEMTAREGVHGWGLSWAWDAFQDGSVNPADTIYTYTTASAGLAFLDGYAVLGDDAYLDVATGAARTLLDVACCWDDGRHATIWYSERPSDQRDGYQVHNTSALSLALLERLAAYGVDLEPELRDRLAAHLIDAQGSGWDRPEQASAANWPYAPGRPVANDLLHETFIVEGLRTRADGQEAADASLAGIVSTHFDAEGIPQDDVSHTLGTNRWGPPAGLYILIGHEAFTAQTDTIAERLVASVREDGTSSFADEGTDRATGWYALALARYAAHAAGADLP